jgi:chromosomal replication initiation ATPase DnaA
MKQQALDLPVEPRYGRADFLVSDSNRAAFEWIERWPHWPTPALVLCGPSGSGKTHLAHLWCERSGAALIAGKTVTPEELGLLSGAIAIDNAEQASERPLLHAYNLCLERGGTLVLTMGAPPAAQPIALADLRSRLRALLVAEIAPPDDELLAAVLLKQFADRQLRVAPGVVAYLVPRMERSFASASSLAAELDRRALAAGRPVTIKLARAVLSETLG